MSDGQTDRQRERSDRRTTLAGKVVDGGLESALWRNGQELLGFSVRLTGVEALLTLRGRVEGEQQVCFVASASLADALNKAYKLAETGELRWRPDKYAKK